MKRTWKMFPQAPAAFVEATGLPPLVAQVLHNRSFTNPHQAVLFINQKDASFHDPYLLPGMDQAVSRIARAIDEGQAIGIFGDFDVDGVTATALLAQSLERAGARVMPYIPHRVDEGHGLNPEAVQALKDSGVSLLITVDCGITSHQEVRLAGDLGMDVIITDHHTPPPEPPPALAVVDPKVPGSTYPFEELTGAGLALKLTQGLYQHLGQPWPRDLLALAALGTVADVAPLQGENRVIVREGLEEMKRTKGSGLQALYRQAGLQTDSLTSESISFSLAPRLNASGRLQHAITSFRLLMTSSDEEADELAAQVEEYNLERRRATEEAYERALNKAQGNNGHILILGDEEFSPGISGLVASRLVEEFYRPAVVMALDGEVVRASGRSIPEFDLVGALYQCQDLFQRFGGHPMAAGFVMPLSNLPSLEQRLTDIAARDLGGLDLQPVLNIDAEALPHQLMGETFQRFNDLEPFGAGNPCPVLLGRGLRLVKAWTMGDRGQHLRFKVHDGRATWDATAFRQGNGVVPQAQRLDLAYSLTTRSWRGKRTLNLNVVDFRPSEAGA